MRLPYLLNAVLLSLPSLLSAQLSENTPVSAAQVQRACANPRVKEVSPDLATACQLTLASPEAEWLRVRDSATALAQKVIDLQTYDAGAMPATPVVTRAQAEPGGEALSASLFRAVQRRDPARFTTVVTTQAPAVVRRAQTWLRDEPSLANRLPWMNAQRAGDIQAASAAAVRARAELAPDLLAMDLTRESVGVQQSVMASFTAGQTVEGFLETFPTDALATERIMEEAREAAGATAVTPSSLAAAFPVSQQSTVLWGVTDLVVSRAEQQAQIYFLQQFSARFCDQHKGLLPASCGILNGTTLPNFRPGLGMLRQAVRQDMEALPAALLRTGIRNGTIPAAHWDAANVAASGALYTVDVLRGTDPTRALRRMADSILLKRLDGTDAPVSKLLGQFAALQAGLLDPSGNLLSPLPDTMPAERQVQRLLLAFALNQPRVWQRLEFAPARLAQISQELHGTVAQYRTLKDSVVRLQRTLADTAAALRAARQTYMVSTSQLADVVLDAAARAGVAQAAELRAAVAPLRSIGVALVNGDYTTAALSTFQLAERYGDSEKATLPVGEMRVFSFVADLAQAENPEAVGAALTRFAGSGADFRSKRGTTAVRFSANAYLGLYGGGLGAQGRMWGEELDDGRSAAFAGAYLPLGVEVTFGWEPWLIGGRFGLFLQAVDLGTLASLRLGGDDDDPPADTTATPPDSVQGAPEVGFAQVFSPGVGVVYNIPGRPWTIGYVYSYSPRLRTLGDQDEERTSDVVRGGLFIAFDIPLFP